MKNLEIVTIFVSGTAFLRNTKLSGYRIGIQFVNSVLVVEQINYASKIVNTYFLNDLDTGPKIPFNNFELKNCEICVVNTATNSDNSKWVLNGYGNNI